MNAMPFPWQGLSAGDAFGALRDTVHMGDLPELFVSIDSTFRGQLEKMLDGIGLYWGHGFHRPDPDHPVVWQEGETRVFAFANDNAGPPVLVVPSLVNKSYILDLEESCSFCAALAASGLSPYLIDWGEPGEAELTYNLSDYVLRLERAFRWLADSVAAGAMVGLVGYCMGGLLALPLAIRQQAIVEKLVLLATPWDFHAGYTPAAQTADATATVCETITGTFGKMPVDWIQAMFMSLDPLLAFKKFQQFTSIDVDSPAARRFVLLEDWLNDGVSLSTKVSMETIVGWYAENKTKSLGWEIDGSIVDPADYSGETLVVIPTADRIVPPESALAITERLEDVRLLRPSLGHIGMMSSRGADELWGRVAKFLS